MPPAAGGMMSPDPSHGDKFHKYGPRAGGPGGMIPPGGSRAAPWR